MKTQSLQLQVKGENIRDAEVSVTAPGVSLDSVARLDGSPDWQYIYLTVTPQAKPGPVKITWREGKKRIVREYQLRERREQRGAQGFSSDDILYMIMPDRFADGDAANNHSPLLRHDAAVDRSKPNVRHGGDLKGIADHIDYIDSLNVTAVWLNPVLENDMPGGSYHGYATTDYYRVDPRFGSNDDYTALIARLHDRGIKTVMDMIFNHSGSEHPWLSSPPASDWFNFQDGFVETNHKLSTVADRYASRYDRQLAQKGWFVREMPDLNQLNPHLMKYLIQNSIWWIEESQIDGIRMDTYPYADENEMKRWIQEVKYEYPDFNIVGECWFADPAAEQFWQEGSGVAAARGFNSGLPVVMDFPLHLKSTDLAPFTKRTDGWNGLSDIYGHMALDYIYANPLAVLRFLDNHDTNRVITSPLDSLDSWKQAVTMLLTIPGIPQLYYGTELLMSGTREGGDGNVRRDVPGGFPGDTENQFIREGRSELQNEAYDFIAKLAGIRKNSEALRRGDMKHFAPDNGVYVYQRFTPDSEVIVMMNGRDEENTVNMSRYAEIIIPGEEYVDLLTGEILIPIVGGNTLHAEESASNAGAPVMTFAPRQIHILHPAKSKKWKG